MIRARPAAAFVLLLGVVVAAHVTDIGDGFISRHRELLSIAHVLGFAAVTFLISLGVRRIDGECRLSDLSRLVVAVFITAAFAVVSEAAQTFTNRSASIGDLGRDAVGIVAGLTFIIAAGHSAWCRRLPARAAMIALGIAAIVGGIYEPGRLVTARALAQARLPQLIGFERPIEAELYSAGRATLAIMRAPQGWPLDGFVARITPIGGRRNPSVRFDGLPPNWARYESLSFVAASARSTGGHLTIRIHDQWHDNQYSDRFNLAFDVGPEPRRIRIPLDDVRAAPSTRVMDLSRIAQIIIFDGGGRVGEFLLDDLRLE
jgi:VanZ family protein